MKMNNSGQFWRSFGLQLDVYRCRLLLGLFLTPCLPVLLERPFVLQPGGTLQRRLTTRRKERVRYFFRLLERRGNT
jgi:hypothetical protein